LNLLLDTDFQEAKVIRRLEDVGDIDLESLTAIVYDDVPEQLHPIAKFSLEAHLLKLLKEGVIKKDNNNFAKI
jgi:hypothetical protein